MFHNQSMTDTPESSQYRRTGRSGSFNQHRGGRGSGGGGAAPPPVSSTSNPSLSSNRSFNKKYTNAQGGQPRVSGASAGLDSHQNGAHQQQPLHDEKEVALCLKDLNSPGFYPSMISIWVTDSFERKDMERDLLAKLLIDLTKSGDVVISEDQLVKGFESVLTTMEDAVNDAPRAAEFLGRIFGRVILEDVIPFNEIGRLIYEGGEEKGRLVEIGLAAEVLGSTLEMIKLEQGDSVVSEMCRSSNMRLEKFRPQCSNKQWKLDKFI